jgi:hypothetical protein
VPGVLSAVQKNSTPLVSTYRSPRWCLPEVGLDGPLDGECLRTVSRVRFCDADWVECAHLLRALLRCRAQTRPKVNAICYIPKGLSSPCIFSRIVGSFSV